MVAWLNNTVLKKLGQSLKNTHFLMMKTPVYCDLPKSLVCNDEEKMHILVTGMNLSLILRIKENETK